MKRSMRCRVAAWFLALMWGGLSADAAVTQLPVSAPVSKHLACCHLSSRAPETERALVPVVFTRRALRPASARFAADWRQGAAID